MYAYIKGIIVEKSPPTLIMEANGIGYTIDAPLSTFADMAKEGEEARVYTHFVVREDAQQLYGFSKVQDKELFIQLLKVSGIGPRMALGILSGLSPAEFQLAVANGEVERLVKIPGVGRKTAERLVIELRGKVDDLLTVSGGEELALGETDEALAALMSLGYKAKDAQSVLAKINTENKRSEDLIREALKLLTGGR